MRSCFRKSARVLARAAFVAVAVSVSAAQALVLPFVEEVTISPAAIAADPVLASYRAFDLKVTIDPGDQFLVAGMTSILSSGSFYSPVGGGTTPVLNASGNLLFDTYVTIPLFNPATPTDPFFAAPGRYSPNPGAPLMPSAGGQTNTVDITWGALGGSGSAGVYTIGRFTLSPDANGPISGEIRTRNFLTGGVPFDTSFFYNTGIVGGRFGSITVPEPVFAAFAAPLLLLRRRRAA